MMSPEHPWVVIGCGARKRAHATPVADLYSSTYVTSAVAWSRSVTTPQRLLVLSAKHGLIDASTVVEPYDVSWGDPGQIDDDSLAAQVAAWSEQGLRGRVIVVASATYLRRLADASGGIIDPYNPIADHLRARGLTPGIGRQIQGLQQNSGRVPC